MWISPQSPIQKIAIVIYGLVAGVLAAMGTSAVCLVLGISISLFAQSMGWIHLGNINRGCRSSDWSTDLSPVSPSVPSYAGGCGEPALNASNFERHLLSVIKALFR